MDFLQDKIQELAAIIDKQKEDVIKQRLSELNITLDEQNEKNRRFKNFVCEIKGDKESYYYNDGSLSGIRVVTFVSDVNQNPMKFEVKLNYY